MCCVSEHPCGQASLISSPPSRQAKVRTAAEKEKKFPTRSRSKVSCGKITTIEIEASTAILLPPRE